MENTLPLSLCIDWAHAVDEDPIVRPIALKGLTLLMHSGIFRSRLEADGAKARDPVITQSEGETGTGLRLPGALRVIARADPLHEVVGLPEVSHLSALRSSPSASAHSLTRGSKESTS